MCKIEQISADVDADVYAEVEAAVSRGELASPEALVKALVTDWVAHQHSNSPAEMAQIRALISESRADPRPSIAAEDVFAELEARYADPA